MNYQDFCQQIASRVFSNRKAPTPIELFKDLFKAIAIPVSNISNPVSLFAPPPNLLRQTIARCLENPTDSKVVEVTPDSESQFKLLLGQVNQLHISNIQHDNEIRDLFGAFLSFYPEYLPLFSSNIVALFKIDFSWVDNQYQKLQRDHFPEAKQPLEEKNLNALSDREWLSSLLIETVETRPLILQFANKDAAQESKSHQDLKLKRDTSLQNEFNLWESNRYKQAAFMMQIVSNISFDKRHEMVAKFRSDTKIVKYAYGIFDYLLSSLPEDTQKKIAINFLDNFEHLTWMRSILGSSAFLPSVQRLIVKKLFDKGNENMSISTLQGICNRFDKTIQKELFQLVWNKLDEWTNGFTIFGSLCPLIYNPIHIHSDFFCILQKTIHTFSLMESKKYINTLLVWLEKYGKNTTELPGTPQYGLQFIELISYLLKSNLSLLSLKDKEFFLNQECIFDADGKISSNNFSTIEMFIPELSYHQLIARARAILNLENYKSYDLIYHKIDVIKNFYEVICEQRSRIKIANEELSEVKTNQVDPSFDKGVKNIFTSYL